MKIRIQWPITSLAIMLCVYSQAACPPWALEESKLPKCPPNGFLGDKFPAVAHVLAEEPDIKEEEGTIVEFTKHGRLSETVRKLLVYSGDETPTIYLNVTEKAFKTVKATISGLNLSPALQKLFMDSIIWIPADQVAPNTWSQDSFQSFANPRTGNAVLRLSEAYPHQKPTVTNQLAKIINADCKKIELGEKLKSFEEQKCGAECGGNIEFLAQGDLCLGGTNKSDGFTRQYCPQEKEVTIPTDWLRVGHVDEYLSTHSLPNKTCGVAIAVGSFRKAMEVLEKDPSGSLFDLSHSPNVLENSTLAERETFRRSNLFFGRPTISHRRRNFAQFCEDFGGVPPLVPDEDSRDELEEIASHDHSKRPTDPKFEKDCLKAKNSDLLAFLNKKIDGRARILEANETLQKNLDEAARKLQTKLKNNLPPECEVKIIELPQIFSSDVEATSLFPNPTNNIPVKQTLLIPHPANSAFKSNIEETFKSVGISTSFIDTIDDIHQREGNLHCAINTIRLCAGDPNLPMRTEPTATEKDVPLTVKPEELTLIERLLKGKDSPKARTYHRLSSSKADIPSMNADSRKQFVKLIANSLENTDIETMSRGIRLLAESGPEGVDAIISQFGNADAQQTIGVLNGISQQTPNSRLLKLIETGLKDTRTDVLRAAISSASRNGFLPAQLMPYINHGDEDVRATTYKAIRDWHGLSAEIIENGIKDPSPKVRLEVAAGVRGLQDVPLANKFTATLLDDTDAGVRNSGYSLYPKFEKNEDNLKKVILRGLNERTENAVWNVMGGALARDNSKSIAAFAILSGLTHEDTLIKDFTEKVLRTGGHELPVGTWQLAYNAADSKTRIRMVRTGNANKREIFRLAVLGNDPDAAVEAVKRLKTLISDNSNSRNQYELFLSKHEPTIRSIGTRAGFTGPEIETLIKDLTY